MNDQILNVAVHGALGKMGRYVLETVSEANDMKLSFGVDKNSESIQLNNKDIPIYDSLNFKDHKIDVLVDFTNAVTCMNIIENCGKNNVDIIIGSTGFTEQNIEELKRVSDTYGITIFLVPNFSIGANLLIKIVNELAHYYDYADLTEMHHENKIDSPSGTAISILESILDVKNKLGMRKFKQNIPTTESIPNTRGGDMSGINVHSRRMPGYVAHHEVVFGNIGETLTLRHDSIDRKSFMTGVLRALRNIKALNGFVYGLDNVI
ncbi:MAG: 4-hydroxy-tetrahydrodipicolinate reductase [Chloroflexi bacterium]|nr:4-hydroxy-tetrahydrodipicolinate reductase [Chloroflexota bacterium]|tara:strand:+ start:1866 stop:2657 length:792 start_codon:yes stop_codon:yes gene_type:complete